MGSVAAQVHAALAGLGFRAAPGQAPLGDAFGVAAVYASDQPAPRQREDHGPRGTRASATATAATAATTTKKTEAAAPEHVLVRVLVVRASPRASRYIVYAQAVDPLAFGAWERRRASVKASQGKNHDARAAAGPGEPEGEDEDGFLNGTSSCERGAINDGSEIDSKHAHGATEQARGASEYAHGASSSSVASCADCDDKDDDDDDEVPGMGTIHTLKVHARGLSQARLERLIAYHLLRDALDPYGNRQTNLQTLPRHLWLSVMEHLEMGDVLATLKVCKRSHAWHQDNLLWKTLLERDRIVQESGDLRLQVWGPRLPAGLVRRISTLAQSLS